MMQDSQRDGRRPRIWPLIRRVMRLAGRDAALFYLAVAAALAQALLNVWFSQGLRGVIDGAVAGLRSAFTASLRQVILSLALLAPLAWAQTYFTGGFSERTLARIRQALAERLAALPVARLSAAHSGDLMSVVNNDVSTLKTLTASDMFEAATQICAALVALVYLAIISWQLTLAATLAVPLMYLLMDRVIGPVSARAAELQGEVGRATSVAQDGLAGLATARAFNLQDVLDERLRAANRSALASAARVVRLRAVASALSNCIPIVPFIITFGVGGWLAITGGMSPGSLLAFIYLLNAISNPLGSVPRLLANMGVAAGGAARVFALLDESSERADGDVVAPDGAADVAVRFSNVEFAYTPGAPVLAGVSFAVRPGETVAVVGPSGSGKSTLLRLLLGFFEPSAGSIELFGHDLRRWRLADARRQMALVAQDTYLFPVSVRENIAYGRPGATQAEIVRAAQLANIHEFIVSLPDGYATLVGERGARLSGGQRQRIALARAILRDAPILLLDEATSALDTESEALVQEALERFMAGRTTIVIAHRLSTIMRADRVIVLAGGRVVEAGTHEQLLSAGGLYRRLYLRQFGDQAGGAGAATGGGRP